jgi:hypothetical protein
MMSSPGNKDTPLKTVFRRQPLPSEPHCFLCLRSPSGKLRNIITNVALPENKVILKDIKRSFDVSLESLPIHESKICLSCKRQLEICVDFQSRLKEAINRSSTMMFSTKHFYLVFLYICIKMCQHKNQTIIMSIHKIVIYTACTLEFTHSYFSTLRVVDLSLSCISTSASKLYAMYEE